MTDDRTASLERHGRLYGEFGFAIAWTAGIEGDSAKACRTKGWERTKPEPAAFLEGIFKSRGPGANPCLVLQPSELVGIDVDGPVGAARLAELLPGGLPDTVTALSGRDGGMHLYFRPPPGCKHHKLEFKSDGSVKAAENGYLVAPPALHPNGREYRFAPNHGFGEIDIAELPANALEAIVATGGADKRERVKTMAEGKLVSHGARRDALLSHAGLLRRAGLGEQAILEGLWTFFTHHCEPDPPADPDDLAGIASAATGWEPGALPAGIWWRTASANGSSPHVESGSPAGPYIDWTKFWSQDEPGPEWLLTNILARGRGHSIYAAHKVGKSLVMLWCVLQLVKDGHLVIYLDYEMTEDDVRERLEDMGAGPETDLSKLRYALLPMLPPLDTAEGGAAVLALVDAAQAEHPDHDVALVIDTIGRAIAGEENPADTIRAFYSHTGIELKRRGVTWARLDHAGWEGSHARGSSAKGDDVDIIWKLVEVDGGRELRRDAARMGWVPEKVTLLMEEGPLRFVQSEQSWPLGTHPTAILLDDLGVPLEAGRRVAQAALREAGHGVRARVIDAALRWRRMRPDTTGTHPDTGFEANRDTSGTHRADPFVGARDTIGTHGTHGQSRITVKPLSLRSREGETDLQPDTPSVAVPDEEDQDVDLDRIFGPA